VPGGVGALMPRLRAVWATLQTCLFLATVAWGVFLLVSTHEMVWASGNFAAAVFFLVTVFLFAADHPDGRIVGMFGVAVFLITNALMVYALYSPGGLPRLDIAEGMGKGGLALIIGAVTLALAIPQALLLLYGHRSEAVENP
jgi:hypothetical protein